MYFLIIHGVTCMDTKTFKQYFEKVATSHSFQKRKDNFVKESTECFLILNLQKSSYSKLYYLNIYIIIKGFKNRSTFEDSKMIEERSYDLFRRQPVEYNKTFDLENQIEDSERKLELDRLFNEYITVDSFLKVEGILNLIKNKEIGMTSENIILLEEKLKQINKR